MTTLTTAPGVPLTDEHSVLLWQTCAYADDLAEAARSGKPLAPALGAMLEFLHYRLLPYLAGEERRLSGTVLRDKHLHQLLVADHERLRADVDNIERSRTRRLLALATDALVDRLDRHVQREETWVTDPSTEATEIDLRDWALPLVLTEEIDVDALPAKHRDVLIWQRLARMRPGEAVRLTSAADLHPVWRRQHACNHNSHIWIYEDCGPVRWRARVTRRSPDDY